MVVWTPNHYDEPLARRFMAGGLSVWGLFMILGLVVATQTAASVTVTTIVTLLLFVLGAAGMAVAFASVSDHSPVCALVARVLGYNDISDAYRAFAERPHATEDGLPHAVVVDQVLASGEMRMRLMRAPRDFDALKRDRFDATVLDTVVVPESATEDEVLRAALSLAERAETLERASSSQPRPLSERDLDDPYNQQLLLVRSALSQGGH